MIPEECEIRNYEDFDKELAIRDTYVDDLFSDYDNDYCDPLIARAEPPKKVINLESLHLSRCLNGKDKMQIIED